MSDDIKERLLNESFKGQEAMRREALARIEALEAQFAAAREALRISLTAMTLASGFEVISIEFEFRHAIDATRAALASLPAPAAAPTREEIAEQPLTANFTKSLPGGALDDSAYEQIEDALDAIDAPMTDNGRYMTLVERILALKVAPAK